MKKHNIKGLYHSMTTRHILMSRNFMTSEGHYDVTTLTSDAPQGRLKCPGILPSRLSCRDTPPQPWVWSQYSAMLHRNSANMKTSINYFFFFLPSLFFFSSVFWWCWWLFRVLKPAYELEAKYDDEQHNMTPQQKMTLYFIWKLKDYLANV